MLRRWLPPGVFSGCAFVFLLATTPCTADPASPSPARAPLEATAIVRAAGPAVVMIRAVKGSNETIGSGFVLSSEGIIVTNYHVVAGATEVQIKLTNGWIFSGLGVVGFDEQKDLALIKVSAPPLTQVTLGNSDALEPGERVVLIGSPQGLKNSVSDGMVSSLRENKDGIKIIQTTAPASPGSSGSPLLNMNGEVVGVLSFKFSQGENLNFAISANHLAAIAAHGQLIPFADLVQTPPSSPHVESSPSVLESSQPPSTPTPPGPAPQTPPSSEEIYNAALSEYTEERYNLAITRFRSYLKDFPKTSMAPNAQYWLAESYYGQKNYPQAIEEFDLVIRDYPDSPKVPSALSKQADAYVQMGDTKQATGVLCWLINKYGGSREARLARDKNIRCR